MLGCILLQWHPKKDSQKKKVPSQKVTSSSLPKKDDGPPHLEYQPENQQREDGVVERGWKLTFDSIHPNTKTVYCQTSSNTYDLVVSETDWWRNGLFCLMCCNDVLDLDKWPALSVCSLFIVSIS